MPAKVTVTGVAQDIARVTNEVEQIVSQIDVRTGGEILDQSPVLTGYFRFNWNRSTGAPNVGTRGTRDPSRRYGTPALGGGWRINQGNIFYANGVDYAEFLDAGRSTQAPQGITEPVATRIDARFFRVI